MPTGVKVNGAVHDWASIETDINGFDFTNLKEINYSDKLDIGKRRGRNGKVTGRTRGDYDAEGDLTLPKADSSEYIASLAALQTPAQPGFGLVEFQIVVNYSDGDGPVITDTLIGCRNSENDGSNSQGTDPSEVKHTLDIIEIKWNGFRMIDQD